MTTENGFGSLHRDAVENALVEEVPCLDAISPNQPEEVNNLRSCILNRLRRRCAKSLMGAWAIPENIDIEQVGGGLSNYLYVASLKRGTPVDSSSTPKKVFVRVYGELLRSNINSVVLDAVIFALLSEKRLGPKLYGVFPGGRIEEFVESRTLRTKELSVPTVRDCIALHMAVLHSLTLPMPKMPTFLFKTMAKFLQQLTGTREPPTRRAPWHRNGNGEDSSSEANGLADDVLINNPPPGSLTASQLFGSTSSLGSVHESQAHLFKFVSDWRLVEEFEWLRTTFFGNLERFPVRFCHNDVQENNLLLYQDCTRRGWSRIMAIDYEYCSYNFRCIDVGNFFNEWTYDNSYPHAPGFAYMPEAYPLREAQLAFWRKYLAVYEYVSHSSVPLGTYIPNRRTQAHSVCLTTPEEVIKHLRSHPSAPDFNDGERGIRCLNSSSSPNYSIQLLSELEEIENIDEVELSSEETESLLSETIYGALFSHLWWTLWALIQSEISSIEFGFIEYATSRMTAYFALKRTLPPSEFVNHKEEASVFDFPGSGSPVTAAASDWGDQVAVDSQTPQTIIAATTSSTDSPSFYVVDN